MDMMERCNMNNEHDEINGLSGYTSIITGIESGLICLSDGDTQGMVPMLVVSII